MNRTIIPPVILLLAVLMPAATLLPSWQAARSAPEDQVYLGFRFMAVDHYQYAAFIRQARDDGRLLMENLFTGEAQRPSYLMPYFWVLGMVTRVTGWSIPAAWEVFRVAGGVLYILVFWRLTARFLTRRDDRILATGLFAAGGGIDWVATLCASAGVPGAARLAYPSESFWNWSTAGTLLVGHWVWAAATFVLAADVLLSRAGWRRDLALFLLAPAIWLIHPYAGMVSYLTFGLAPLIPLAARDTARARDALRRVAPALLSFVPVGLYLLWARGDEVFRLTSQRGLTWTVTFGFWWYPVAYGALLPLAWLGLRGATKRPDPGRDLVLAWMGAAAVLSLNPFLSGVKFQYLLFPPLAIAAALGVARLLRENDRRLPALRRTGPAIALGLALTLGAPVDYVRELVQGPPRDVYAPVSFVEACRWLEGQPDGLVFAGYWTGNRVPWLAGKRVFFGHWFLTIEGARKREELLRFFDPQASPSEKADILEGSDARYLFYGPSERRSSPLAPGLPVLPAYRNAGIVIYDIPRPR